MGKRSLFICRLQAHEKTPAGGQIATPSTVCQQDNLIKTPNHVQTKSFPTSLQTSGDSKPLWPVNLLKFHYSQESGC